MKIKRLLLCLLTVLLLWGAAPPDPYQLIETQQQLEEVYKTVEIFLNGMGLKLKHPVKVSLLDSKALDKIYSGPYQGMEVGLHGMRDGSHLILIIQGETRDSTGGILAHESAHAWEVENCWNLSDQVLSEGFAEWVKYKYYDKIGAYMLMEEMRGVRDPVYGEGLRRMLEWEDRYGVNGVLEQMKKK